MTEFCFESYRLSLDVEATQTYYAAHPLPWITCDCTGCRNFVRAVKSLPPAITDFFNLLGLDPEKPAEVCMDAGYEKSCLYGSWYHIKGTFLAGEPLPGHRCGEWLALAEGVSAAFSSDCHLLPEDFPQPCIQLDLEWRLPWLLAGKNPYYSDR